MSREPRSFQPINLAIITVSDKHTPATDSSGDLLAGLAQHEGHYVSERLVLPHNRYLLRADISRLIASTQVQVVIVNGGTGFADHNVTIDAIKPLLDKEMLGFGEQFRHLSFLDIGSSSLQSQACAGLANGTLICAIPGSEGACELAWQALIAPQIDARVGPCNSVAHLKNSQQTACSGERT